MKSQVNALLSVVEGLITDARLAYPALRGALSKDLERIALYSQTRGIGLFTLDLPSLDSALTSGVEVGRLRCEGPLSNRVSKHIHVPRLYSGLWLRVFEKDASLKQNVDVTALAFLRQLLTIGKKLELGSSYDRHKAIKDNYHGIERRLRRPSLDWDGDSLFRSWAIERNGADDSRADPSFAFHWPCDLSSKDEERSESEGLNAVGSSDQIPATELACQPGVRRTPESELRNLHFVQANDGSGESLPLFYGLRESATREEKSEARQDQALLTRLQQVADCVIGSFDIFDPVSFSASLEEDGKGIGFKHGPGAVAERLKSWEKSQFPNWPAKLQRVFPFALCGRTVGSDAVDPPQHEVASRLIAVPKTSKGPRLIAAEPTAHQWCQQLVWRFLQIQCRKAFGSNFIDFKDQSKSGDLVLKASRDGSLATVDLSDASDRLTCWTVERIFRSNPSILAALHAARTRYLRDDILGDRSFLKLKKFASQGTAVTFPVMSLTMLCIALAASLQDGDKVSWRTIGKLRTKVRVFGDDIIIPTHGYARLVRLMEMLQLKVNEAKSFVSGKFRESCGVDGYDGYDVTAVKPKTLVVDSPASAQSLIDTTNNLFNKGYWHASVNCELLIPLRLRRRLRVVGRMDAGFSGLTSFVGSDESHLIQRWNTRLHRNEVRVWALCPSSTSRPRDGFGVLLDFMSSHHNHEHARIVSETLEPRKSRDRLLWEPSCDRSRLRVAAGIPR